MSKFGCHYYDDNRIFLLSAFGCRCGSWFGRQHSAFNSVIVVSSRANMDRIQDCLLTTEFIWSSANDFQFGPCGCQPHSHSRIRLSTMFDSNFPCHLFCLLSTSQEHVTERSIYGTFGACTRQALSQQSLETMLAFSYDSKITLTIIVVIM